MVSASPSQIISDSICKVFSSPSSMLRSSKNFEKRNMAALVPPNQKTKPRAGNALSAVVFSPIKARTEPACRSKSNKGVKTHSQRPDGGEKETSYSKQHKEEIQNNIRLYK